MGSDPISNSNWGLTPFPLRTPRFRPTIRLMTRAAIRRLALVTTLLAAAACASGGGAHKTRLDRNTITREQIDLRGFTNALEAVEALHSNWLVERAASLGENGAASIPHKWVYMDNVRLGGLDQLRSIPVTNIVSIKYFDGSAATQRWGIDHGLGVIQVLTQR